MPDVEPHLNATAIREMIRRENEVTNHRIMWLLIVQGLIANASVTAGRERRDIVPLLASLGILVTLSAFVILYKSYQARGYLPGQGRLRHAHGRWDRSSGGTRKWEMMKEGVLVRDEISFAHVANPPKEAANLIVRGRPARGALTPETIIRSDTNFHFLNS